MNARLLSKRTQIVARICLTSSALILLIQDVIRPKHYPLNPLGVFLLDTLPNFFAAVALLPLFYLFISNLPEKPLNNTVIYLAAIITISGLIGWEFVRYQYGHMAFDFRDVYITIAGALFAILLLKKVTA